jgi:uncharacterized membrane protein YadS
VTTPAPSDAPPRRRVVPGVAVAAAVLGIAWLLHLVLPAVPVLTGCVVLGIVLGQVPALRPALDGVLSPGLTLAAKRLLRIGVVLSASSSASSTWPVSAGPRC